MRSPHLLSLCQPTYWPATPQQVYKIPVCKDVVSCWAATCMYHMGKCVGKVMLHASALPE